MALLQTRVALRTDVRIAIGQRMWLHVFLSFKLCFPHKLLRLIKKPKTN